MTHSADRAFVFTTLVDGKLIENLHFENAKRLVSVTESIAASG